MALTYDSVQLFAETTKHLTVRNVPLNCSDRSESVLDDGSTFKNYMRTVFARNVYLFLYLLGTSTLTLYISTSLTQISFILFAKAETAEKNVNWTDIL